METEKGRSTEMMLKVLGMAHEQAVKGLIRDAFSAEPWCDRWEDEDVFHSYILDGDGQSEFFGPWDFFRKMS